MTRFGSRWALGRGMGALRGLAIDRWSKDEISVERPIVVDHKLSMRLLVPSRSRMGPLATVLHYTTSLAARLLSPTSCGPQAAVDGTVSAPASPAPCH